MTKCLIVFKLFSLNLTLGDAIVITSPEANWYAVVCLSIIPLHPPFKYFYNFPSFSEWNTSHFYSLCINTNTTYNLYREGHFCPYATCRS